MSVNRLPFEMEFVRTEDLATECVICGEPIPAGAYPPVCRDKERRSCRFEWDINIEFNEWRNREYEHKN